jgi:hypothetical protein
MRTLLTLCLFLLGSLALSAQPVTQSEAAAVFSRVG